ncbi:PucR family transcriptional regulator, partial [Patulibacter sp. S7RM1-6]
ADGLEPTREEARGAMRLARAQALPAAVADGTTAFGPPDEPPTFALLVACPLAELTDAIRVVVNQVLVYATLEASRSRAGGEFRAGVAAELLGLVAHGELSDAGLAVRLRALELPAKAALAVVASDNAHASLRYAAEALDVPCVATERDEVGLLLVAPGSRGDVADELARELEDAGVAPVLGVGRAGRGTESLRRSLREALAALALAKGRPTGRRVVHHLDVGSHALLLALTERHLLEAFRDAVLGPVERWDAERGTDLVGTLRAFLEHGRRWRVTAGELHVHHNTLRHRLARVERLTGRALDDTGDCVDFHLALAIPPRT